MSFEKKCKDCGIIMFVNTKGKTTCFPCKARRKREYSKKRKLEKKKNEGIIF